jgi:hypothetical protein
MTNQLQNQNQGDVSTFLLSVPLSHKSKSMASAKKAVEEDAVVVVTVVAVAVHLTSTVKLVKRKSPSLLLSSTLTLSPSDSDKKVHNSWGGDDGETERKVEEAATNDALVENANVASGLNDWAGGAADAPADDWAASADAPKDDWAAPPAAEGAEKPQSGEKRERRGDREEEEDNTLTFDQYLAQQREKENALVPKLDVRKPNDGADDDVFKGAAPLQKDDLEYFAPKVYLFLYLLIVAHTSPGQICPKGSHQERRQGLHRDRSSLRTPKPWRAWRSWWRQGRRRSGPWREKSRSWGTWTWWRERLFRSCLICRQRGR